MIDPFSTRLHNGPGSEFHYHSLLSGLSQLTTEDGLSHVAGNGSLLCGAELPEQLEPGLHARGKEALKQASCPRCEEAASRILACVELEAATARSKAGPAARLLVDRALGSEGKRDLKEVAKDLAELENRSYARLWLSLAGLAICSALGLLGLGLCLAALGCLQRLLWLGSLKRYLR